MAEFLTPRMPEADGEPESQVPLPPGRFGDPETPDEPVATEPIPDTTPERGPAPSIRTPGRAPGALARLISLVLSVGLAWALVVALTAWVLGLFLTRG